MTIPINTITAIRPKVTGRDYNFFQKLAVNSASFGHDGYNAADGYQSDMFITFPAAGIIFSTEGTGTNTIEYSFNGHTVHGELIPSTATTDELATKTFLNRKVTGIWFRVKAGSSGPITVSVEAWADA